MHEIEKTREKLEREIHDLKNSLRLYKSIADDNINWITWRNRDGEIKYTSQAFEKITGFSVAEITGKREFLSNIIHPDDKKIYEKHLDRNLENNKLHETEFRIITKSGETRWIRHECQPVYDDDNVFIGYRSSNSDITERKQNSEQIQSHLKQTVLLQQTIERLNRAQSLKEVYKAAVKGIIDVMEADRSSILIFGEDRRVHFKAWHKLSAKYRKAADGHSPWRYDDIDAQPLCYPDIEDSNLDKDIQKIILAEGIRSLLFVPLVQPDRLIGKFMVYFNENCSCSEERLRFAQVIAQNLASVISRLQALEETRKSERKYRSIFDNSAEGIYQSALKGKLITVNPAMVKMFGYKSKEDMLALENTAELYWDAEERRRLAKLVDSEGCSRNVEVKMKRADGTPLWVLMNDRLVKEKGKKQYYEGALIDITDRKVSEEELLQSEKRMRSLMRLTRHLELARSYSEIFNPLKEEFENILGYNTVSIYLFDEDRKFAKLLIGAGDKGALFKEQFEVLKIEGDSFLEEIAEADHIVVVEDARTDPRTDKEIVAQIGNRTIINIPIILENQRLGTIGTGTFGDEGVRVPSKSDLDYMETVAHHVGVVIDRIEYINERIRTAEKISELAEFNKSIVSSAPVGILTINIKGEITSANETFLRMMGSPSPEETLKIGLDIPAIKNTGLTEAFKKALIHGESFNIKNFPYVSHWGKELIINLKGVPQKTEDGSSTGMIVVVDDISEREKAEQALRESEEKYQLLSDATFEAIFMSDKGICTGQNKTAEKMFGYSLEEALGRPGTEWIIPEDREIVMKHMITGYEKPYEVTALRKDGTTFPCEIQARMFNYQGKSIRLTALRDITERKNAEMTRKRSEDNMRSLMRLTRQLEQARSYTDLIRPILNEIQIILGYRTIWFYLFEKDRKYMRLLTGAGEKKTELKNHARLMKVKGNAFLEEIAEADHVVIIADARTDPRTNKENISRMDNRTIISIPVILENNRLGVIATGTFGDEGVNVPSKPDLEYLEAVSRHLAVVIDRIGFITERTRTAEKIAELADFNKNIVSSAPVGILTINLKGKITSANEALLEMMGSPGLRETLRLGMNIPSVKNTGIAAAFQKALMSGEPFEIKNLPYISYWGKELIVDVKGVPQKAKDGSSTGLIIVVDDVTARVETEQALRENERKYGQLFRLLRTVSDNMIDMLWAKDMDKRYIFANKAICDNLLNAKDTDEPIGKTDMFFAERERNRHPGNPLWHTFGEICNDSDQAIIDNKKEGRFDEFGNVKGKFIFLDVYKSPLFNEQGEMIGVVGSARDVTIEKEILKKLEESEEKYRTLVNSVQEIIFQTDAQGNWTFLNPAWTEITGFEIESSLNTSFLDYVHPDDRERNTEEFRPLIERKKDYCHHQVRYLTKDGNFRWIEVTARLLLDDNGNVAGTAGTLTNITQRKNAEEALKESYHFNESLIQTIPFGIDIVDEEGNIIFMSGNLKEHFGEGTLGNKCWELYRDDGLQCADCPLLGEMKLGESRSIEVSNVFGGREYEITHTVMKYKDKKVLLEVFKDITEAKKLEVELESYRKDLEKKVEQRTEALKKSEETFRALAENSFDIIIRFNREHKVLYGNPIVEKIIRRPIDKLIGLSVRELGFPVNVIVVAEKALQKVFITGIDNRVEFQMPNGVWVDWLLVPEKDEQGNVLAVIVSGRDITNIKNLETNMKIALENEREINYIKTQLINTVSHEFRTPLTSIYSTVELFEKYFDKLDIEKRMSYFNRIKRSVENLDEMVKELLTLSRFESGSIKIEYNNINIKRMIDEKIVDLNDILKKGQKIAVRMKLRKEVINIDNKALSSIITNLISNASKYSSEGSGITLKLADELNKLRIEVADEGIGISDEEKKRIFEPFFRAKKAINIKGTGLGLSIISEYVKLLKGSITVRDNKVKGTIFIVELPIVDERKDKNINN